MKKMKIIFLIATLTFIASVTGVFATWSYGTAKVADLEGVSAQKVDNFTGPYSNIAGAYEMLENGGTEEELQIMLAMIEDLADAESNINQALSDRDDGYWGWGVAGRDFVGSTDNSKIPNLDITQGERLQQQYGITNSYFIADESQLNNGYLYLYTTSADMEALKQTYISQGESGTVIVAPVFRATYVVRTTGGTKTITLTRIDRGSAPFRYYIEQAFLGGLVGGNQNNKIPSFNHTQFVVAS